MHVGSVVPIAILGLLAGFPQSAFATDPQATALNSGNSASGNPEDAKMKALENEIDVLKEKVFSSKARLLQLQQITLHGAAAGAIARIHFKNDMGGSYHLESATWVLDGQTIYRGSAPETRPPSATASVDASAVATADNAPTGTLIDGRDINLFDGAIVPGSHNLTVTLVYRGAGYQVFTYLEGYRFTVQSSYAFLAEEGKTTELTVAASPKQQLMHSYEERLDVTYALSSRDSVLPPAGTQP